MATRQHRFAAAHLRTLYQLGAIGDLSDRQLLERFATSEGEPAELAFAALVERHGPMVLRACSALLRDPHDAQDVFQATFLVLLRKGHELWIHDSLGPWLHRVARRLAVRTQESARRRRDFERRAAISRTMLFSETCGRDGRWTVLHEEIDRLPERYRVPVVLYHLEGQSHELVAKTLLVPVGTVKSRLHKARDLLRGRLSRRGMELPAGLLSAARVSSAAEALHSSSLFESVVGAAARSGAERAGGTGLISARTIHLVEEAIKAMFLTKMKIGALVVILAAGLAAGAAGVFAGQGPSGQGGPSTSQRTQKSASGPARPAAAGREPAPSYIRQSRKMIIERLERELSWAENRLDRTIERVSANDPEAVRARKTVDTLADLLTRIDAVLVEAVDEFPTSFDFAGDRAARAAAADPNAKTRAVQVTTKPVYPSQGPHDDAAADPTVKTKAVQVTTKPVYPSQGPPYDEHSLAKAAERMEWAKKMHEKGFLTRAQRDLEVQNYEALKARIDADITSAGDRVDWAKRMFEKGYVSKTTYDTEILKHYDALKARFEGKDAVNDAVLQRYHELLKKYSREHPVDPAKKSAPDNPATKPGQASTPDTPATQPGHASTPDTPATQPGHASTPERPASE